jgi:predicted phosphodiesterase
MRIGLITDIHDEVNHLSTALNVLATQQVDKIVQLGDAIDLFGPGRDTTAVVQLLNSAGAIGVWGNHDVGYCREITEAVREKVDPSVLSYMAGMAPRLEVADCHFSHVDPYLDPTDILSLWMASEKPDSLEKAMRSFSAISSRIMFMGHYHRWLVVSDRGPVAWDAKSPLFLNPERRFLIVVGPLVSGDFGVYDTGTCTLTPFRC